MSGRTTSHTVMLSDAKNMEDFSFDATRIMIRNSSISPGLAEW